MSEVSFYLLHVDYIDDPQEGKKGIIRLFGKTKNGQRVCVLDPHFSAYFWAILEDDADITSVQEKISHLSIEETKRLAKVTNVKEEEKNYFGRKVKALKIEVNNPRDISPLYHEVKHIEGVERVVETDITFARRYLVDKQFSTLGLCTVKGKQIDSPYAADIVLQAETISQEATELLEDPKVLAFDLEVYCEGKIPEDDKDPIVMVGLYGSDNFKRVLVWKKFNNPPKYVEFVEDEKELITKFKDIVKAFKPDYLIGYYTDGFDFPYLKARAEKHKIALDIGVDGSKVKFSKRAEVQKATVTGYPHVDVFKFIRRVLSQDMSLPAYDLDTVANYLLGKGKTGADIGQLYKAWNENPDDLKQYCEYNLRDAQVTYELLIEILPHLHEFVKITGLPPDQIARMSYGQIVEQYVIRNIYQFNELIPNRPSFNRMKEREGETFEGAFVYEPNPGLYKEIAVFDFKSLYPSIISAHNVCPSALTEDEEDTEIAPEIIERGRAVQYHFSKKRKGIFSTLLNEILIRRGRVKELLNKNKKDTTLIARHYSLKILANSTYGYFAFSGARWYSNECAAATTAYAREYIQNTIKQAEEAGFTVIYGDTDSVFLTMGEKTREDALKFLEGVNATLPGLMELEVDGFYPRGIFVMKKGDTSGAKKKYALVDDEEHVKVTGFETVRGDWSPLAKETQKEVLRIILVEDNLKKAVDYVKNIVQETRNGKIPFDKLTITKKLTRNVEDYVSVGPHVVVAKRLIERGEKVGSGSKISYVVQEGKGSIGDNSVPLDEAENYNSDYYIDNQVIPAVEQIFSVLNYDKEDLKGMAKQKSLGDF